MMRFTLLVLFLLQPRAFADSGKSFNEVITTAVDNIEEVRTKESEVRSADIARDQSVYHFLPDLVLVGSTTEFGPEPRNRDIVRSYGLQSNMNLFRFGGDLQLYRAADSNLTSLRFDLQNTRLKLEEVLVLKSLGLIASHLETEIRKKIIDAQRSFFSVAEKRYGRGILSRQELDQVTIDLRIAEARLKDATLTEFKNREALKVYFNTKDPTTDPGKDLPEAVSTSWPWLKSMEAVSDHKAQFKVQNHPAWRQLENQVKAAEYASKNNFSSLLPTLDLALSYKNGQGPATGDEWTPQWTGLVTLTVPLFNRLADLGAYKLAKESELRIRLALERSTRELNSQWTTADTEFATELSSAITREQTLKISNTLYQDNLRRFQAGRTNANDLFQDQDRLYQAQLLVVQGWRSAHESYMRLCHSTGQSLAVCQF